MRNLRNIILILTLGMLTTTLSAQYQSIFGNQQTSWFMHSWGVTPQSIDCIPDSMWVVYGQDTTLQNITFKPIYKQSSYQHSPSLIGFVGEDTTSGKVWYRANSSSISHNVMDMSLTVNDSFDFDYGSLGIITAVVDSVYFLNSRKIIELDFDEEIIANNGRKMVSYTMIEGVGVNTRGVNFNQGNSILKHQWKDNNLDYVAQIDSIFYCDTLTSLFEKENNYIAFDIFPNPIRETANITLNELDAERVELIDLSGRLVKSFSVKAKELNFSDVSNGVYFIRITTTSQEQFTQKVVVQK